MSLAHELADLALVLESAEMLAELLATAEMPDEETLARAPKMLAAVIELALARVRLLRRVVIGGSDVSAIASRRNTKDSVRRGDDPDVLLPPQRPKR